jgi:hypothetical protein
VASAENSAVMGSVFDHLLSKLDIHPVLTDIGASDVPPQIWAPIAMHSVYVGFDPDPREMQPPPDHLYSKAVIVDEAVTYDASRADAHFYFTKSPACSSTLKPDAASLSEYLFADLFLVEREQDVRATTLDAVLDRLALPGVDWLKTDSQGTDLRLFESLKPDRRARVLALDLEPGLIDAYVGEDLFVDAHKQLVRSGFWLSDLAVQGTVKMRGSTLGRLKSMDMDLVLDRAATSIKITPGWVNARYLRTLSWLAQGAFSKRDYVLLWIFACLDGQIGFASDLAIEYEKRFGEDATSQFMLAEALQELRRLSHQRQSVLKKAKSFFSRMRH